MTSAEDPISVSLNLSALAEENMGSAIAELETVEAASGKQGSGLTNSVQSEEEGSAAQREPVVLPPASESSMQDYHQLQQNLLTLTVAFTIVIFLSFGASTHSCLLSTTWSALSQASFTSGCWLEASARLGEISLSRAAVGLRFSSV